MTIVEAIRTVLKRTEQPLTSKEIYKAIVETNLYDFKAINPEAVVNSQIRRHSVELDFPSASPIKHFRIVEGNKYSLKDTKHAADTETPPPPGSEQEADKLPEEKIDEAYKQHLWILKQQLLEVILRSDPAFFERLVIELLLRMGYGGSNPNAGLHRGKPGDGGVDGIIKQDQLGLELIYIQAKRYALNRKVQEPEIRLFAGALSKVHKGVFITTSEFAPKAEKFADRHEKTIILVDGGMLSDLMVSNGVGVSEVQTYKTLRIDYDYFSEGT